MWKFCVPAHTARRAAQLFLLVALLPMLLTAETVYLHFDGTSASVGINRVVDGANWYDTSAEVFYMTQLPGGTFPDDLMPKGSSFFAFCIEPREFISEGGDYWYTVAPLSQGTTNIGGMGEAKALKLEELFGRFYPVFGVPLDQQKAAALQIAIWEIVREDSGTLDVHAGNTQFRNETLVGTIDLAQSYLSAIDGKGPRAEGLLALISGSLTVPGTQDVIVQDLPEPGTLGLAGLACAVLLGRVRRRLAAAA
jgi:hypothetical protein